MTDRRRFLLGAGAAVLGAGAAACSDDSSGTGATTTAADRTTTSTDGTTTSSVPGGLAVLTAADFDGLGACKLLPEQMAGPFPLQQQFDRRDITEGVPGHPMRLGLRVVDQSCAPVAGSRVEVWHADSSGDYSAFIDDGGGKDEGPGTTFLRGTQTAADDGIVEFTTIYPGGYTGRAVHVHLRVHTPDASVIVLTSQLYFDGTYTNEVFSKPPYAEFGPPDTTNEADGIAGDPPNDGTQLRTAAAETPNGRGTLALAVLGVDPAARSTA